MNPNPSGSSPLLVASLARAARREPVARKLVVAPSVAAGRELLRNLAMTRGGWVGFEVTTPRPLALLLARPRMERDGVSALDAFEEQALVDRALDAALTGAEGPLASLAEGVGFRERVHDSVTALRLAGVDPRALERARFTDADKRRFLLRVLRRYERLLVERSGADTAAILRLALEALEEGGATLPGELDAKVVLLVPGLGTRGLTGRLLGALTARGAKVLETDPVVGLARPEAVLWRHGRVTGSGSRLFAPGPEPDGAEASATGGTSGADGDAGLGIELFRAASLNDELREVLRRAVDRGLRWDEVEIVTPDPAAYGSAMHALSTRLGIGVTYAVGLPVERTRTGRVVRAYLEWVEGGFEAGPIRRLLEAGDLRPRKGRRGPTPAALARRFRALRIGWGRKRYRAQIRAALAALEHAERGRHESAEGFEQRVARIREELEALRSVLFPTLRATPAVPDRVGVGGERVSPSEIARGLQAFLRRVPPGRGPDRQAREQIARVLERVEATLRRRTDFGAALAILRGHLAIRVRSPRAGGDADDPGPAWLSQGGCLHLADLEHGGYSGRRAVFLVGMDADTVAGARAQDPILLDGERRVLGDGLPTSTELGTERTFHLAALFARLRGSVTLSYTAWNAVDARAVGPSPIVLQALRLARDDETLTFRDLDEALGRVATPVPAPSRPALDAEDVWMAALGGGGMLRSGVEAVRVAFPHLDRGLSAEEERRTGAPSAVHGVIEPRPEELDPRRSASAVMSPSRLEGLGSCPLRYLHGTVLRVQRPDDPELDPDRWLDARGRGGVLHSVYEGALREAHERQLAFSAPGFEEVALRVLAEAVRRARDDVPAPGEGAVRRDVAALEADVRSFVSLVRERGASPLKLEFTFGMGDDEPVALAVGGGTIRLRGAIDRVDHDLRERRVIDYKTGRPHGFDAKTGTFHGGRRLQHALYALVAEERLGEEVASGEYHHPTRRGENQVYAFPRSELEGVRELLGHMLDGVGTGSFVPTDDESDCRFCDYAEICRVRVGAWSKVHSPMAEWSKEQVNLCVHPQVAPLKRARTFED